MRDAPCVQPLRGQQTRLSWGRPSAGADRQAARKWMPEEPENAVA